ncbi:hypothetical protein [Lactiplantibacillus carotarum]|uniref:hypothetical protein n=1 Tax=Lactiplantibacillus carotarum TaxID=2993456 RepID=UPI00298F11D8|nr:hypothetical protein [Lactiplantibacillus carotarum]
MSFLQIWLQRLALLTDEKLEFGENICKSVDESSYSIWNSDWVKGKYKMPPIVLEDELNSLVIEVSKKSFDTFDEYNE